MKYGPLAADTQRARVLGLIQASPKCPVSWLPWGDVVSLYQLREVKAF
jgi:hypothetical protein